MNNWKSTSTTTINSTLMKNSYAYNKKKVGLEINGNIYNNRLSDKFDDNEQGLIDLISDQPKVFVTTTSSFYHFFHDCVGEFLSQYEKTPEAKFIIDITPIADLEPLPEFIKFFFRFLNKSKIDYRPIDFRKVGKLNINKYYYRNPDSESHAINHASTNLREFGKKFVSDLEVKPSKKVFLSRKNFRQRDLSVLIKDRLPYQNDDRLDDEKRLEDYFRDLGFEIVVPEDFKTMEDQIDYFYGVKTLVSLTGSGITNACFLQEGGTIVEIMTPLISFSGPMGNGKTTPLPQGQQEIHHFYHAMALELNHKYIAIPNMDRSVEDVIGKIEKDSYLKALLSN